MRRWILSAALLAGFALPLWGQRGGGGHGASMGGGHAVSGGGGGYAAHSSAGSGYHGAVGYRAPVYSGPYRSPSYTGAYRAPGANGNNWHGNNWHGNGWVWNGSSWAWRGYPYRGGWGWGYPWWGAGLGWSSWWWPGWNWGAGWNWDSWDNSYSYPVYASPSDTYAAQNYQAQNYSADAYVNPGASPDYPADARTQDEIDRLQGEVEQLRAQQSAGAPPGTVEIHAGTVLVYRDGHSEEVQNYAIVGNTIWIFNESHARKVALSELDLPVTKRDNEDRGIEFVIPSPR